LCDALARAARTITRLVSHCATDGMAVPGARSAAPDNDAPFQSRCSCCCRHGRDQEASNAAYAAAQLRYPPAGAEDRHPLDPGPARNGDILPTNNRLKHASVTDFILASARP